MSYRRGLLTLSVQQYRAMRRPLSVEQTTGGSHAFLCSLKNLVLLLCCIFGNKQRMCHLNITSSIMKQKVSLLIGIIAIVIIILFSIKKPTPIPEHPKLDGTNAVLKNKDTKAGLKNYQMNFYMENSASMDGYVNGNTEFKDVLGKMIVSSHHNCKSTDFYFVNNQVYKADQSAIDFIQMLNPAKIKVGNVGSTDVNQIFRNILKEAKKNVISVLFSDCIYSVTDVNSQLDNAKNATTDAFLTALSKNNLMATIILQFVSKFDGFYYDRNDKPFVCKSPRPFYVVITGNRDALKTLYADFKVDNLPGLKNKCFLSSESWSLDDKNACAIISDYTNARRIKTMKNYLDLDEISLDRSATSLQFAIGVDYSNIFVDDTYILDKDNYQVEPDSYKVVGVSKASSSAIGDFSMQPTKPYAITLSVPNGSLAPMVTISLKKGIPAWVKKANVVDDSGYVPSSTQSFAIQKMIEGISAAYNEDYADYFKVQININKYNK